MKVQLRKSLQISSAKIRDRIDSSFQKPISTDFNNLFAACGGIKVGFLEELRSFVPENHALNSQVSFRIDSKLNSGIFGDYFPEIKKITLSNKEKEYILRRGSHVLNLESSLTNRFKKMGLEFKLTIVPAGVCGIEVIITPFGLSNLLGMGQSPQNLGSGVRDAGGYNQSGVDYPGLINSLSAAGKPGLKQLPEIFKKIKQGLDSGAIARESLEACLTQIMADPKMPAQIHSQASWILGQKPNLGYSVSRAFFSGNRETFFWSLGKLFRLDSSQITLGVEFLGEYLFQPVLGTASKNKLKLLNRLKDWLISGDLSQKPAGTELSRLEISAILYGFLIRFLQSAPQAKNEKFLAGSLAEFRDKLGEAFLTFWLREQAAKLSALAGQNTELLKLAGFLSSAARQRFSQKKSGIVSSSKEILPGDINSAFNFTLQIMALTRFVDILSVRIFEKYKDSLDGQYFSQGKIKKYIFSESLNDLKNLLLGDSSARAVHNLSEIYEYISCNPAAAMEKLEEFEEAIFSALQPAMVLSGKIISVAIIELSF